jgi:hypothetical protein
MEAKGQSGAAPAGSPLLSLRSSYMFCVFSISMPPHHKITRGGHIVGFSSRQFRRGKGCINWTHKGEVAPHHMGQVLGRMVSDLFLLVAFPIDFFFSRYSIS